MQFDSLWNIPKKKIKLKKSFIKDQEVLLFFNS